MMTMTMGPDVLFGEDNSAICQPIELKFSGMADFTIEESDCSNL